MKASSVSFGGAEGAGPWRPGLPWARAVLDRRAAQLLGAGLVGAVLGGWFWQDEIDTLERLQQEVQALQARAAAAGAAPSAQAGAGTARDAVTDAQGHGAEPLLAQQAQVWAWLQQGLHSHGLQVLALRPGALERSEGLPSQTLVLELQGRWQDWQVFERRLGALATWWTPEQWQVVPAGGTDDEARLVWHLRLGWRAESGRAQGGRTATALPLPAWPLLPARAQVTPAGPDDTRPAQQATAWRLQGTWQQDGVWHAVLAQGANRWVVVPGQRLGPQGTPAMRVQQVSASGVELRPTDALQAPLKLELSGEGRR